MNKRLWVHKYFFLLTIFILVISLLLPGCGSGAVVDEEKAVVTQEEEGDEVTAGEEKEEEPSAPTEPEQPLTLAQPPEITLDDAATILNVHSILPNSFGHNTEVGEASVSNLLGIGSKSEMFIEGQLPSLSAEGEVIETRPWCEIQSILWIVDSDTAQQVSVADALEEYGLDGYPVDLGMSAEALLNGGDGSGLDFLMIKYGRVFVILISWYSHPRDNYVSLVDLGQVIVERLSKYAQ